MSGFLRTILQLLAIAGAIAVAYYFYQGDAASISEANRAEISGVAKYDMLSFLDEKIACQENNKDVRCWSSVNKLQMFVAGAEIKHEAVGVRIEKYHELIDGIWSAASADSERTGESPNEIAPETLLSVLQKRFPHEIDPSTGKTEFAFGDPDSPVLVMQDLVKDYSDTIETWRLLQSWASSKSNERGSLEISPVFSEAAVEAFHEFLSVYDIALLKRAKQIANQRKQTVIDAESMALAFVLETPSTTP